jgi:hypothetical protein
MRPLPNGISTTADYDDLDRLTALGRGRGIATTGWK